MSLIKLLVVWTPEVALNIVIILLVVGLKDQLKFKNIGNLIKFLSSVACLDAASIVLDRFVSFNVIVNIIYHAVIYFAVIVLIYKVDFRKAFIGIILMYFTFLTLENTYYPFLVSYVSGGIEQYNNNITQYILFSCITRLAQMGLIVFLWKNQYVFLVTTLSKKINNIFNIFIFVLMVCETCISYLYAIYFGQMSLEHQIIYGSVLVTMVVLHYALIYKVIYSSIKGIIVQGYKQYQMLEQGAEEAFKSVYSLLDNNEVEAAKNYISLLVRGEEKINSFGGDKNEE